MMTVEDIKRIRQDLEKSGVETSKVKSLSEAIYLTKHDPTGRKWQQDEEYYVLYVSADDE